MGDAHARTRRTLHTAAAAALAAALAAGCEPRAGAPVVRHWVVGRSAPAFDPGVAGEPVRDALERLLTRGLVEEDTSGAVVPAAADRWDRSADGLTLTFRLRAGLRFTDGTPCSSAHFARALGAGLARSDAGLHAWALAAVRGVDRVRPGRPLPPLGIETPDPRTLVLRLERADPDLPRRLALPGVGRPWRVSEGAGWASAHGLGPYAIARAALPRGLTLARARGGPEAPDTVHVRFVRGAAGARDLLRDGAADLVFPPPPGLHDRALPAGHVTRVRSAVPRRVLLLLARADVRPTSRIEARRALAHGVNRAAALRALGVHGRALESWFEGAPPFDFPRLDGDRVRAWMARGRLGRSFSAALVYDAEGPAARLARSMQGQWAEVDIAVDLRPLRGTRLADELAGGTAALALVESPRLLGDPASDLAVLVQPPRGPTAGGLRTGWRTREFDRWLEPGRRAPTLVPGPAQRRVEEEGVALPIARLPWVWVERVQGPAAVFHGRYGALPADPLAAPRGESLGR